ncbi:uncharacterized protein BCR38DRAFT_352092 [Pseudomassariella vexata]|uniref:Uncharacterized protein n=1 Tax=Pseudomassariella vexata TaxID=1141098 RepID=A0A1Y2DII8_9PEZI|nr:uncharacterized protein BCR38DRAFT_352092 [Pseudomassariella vexata]ORY59052.1 hypothetical protein BCR38DRAFT_352092 [Pseudomassariella vexata]
MASATTNPTAGLQSALDDFQGVLSKEDKTKLQRIKGTPNADSVIQFTALLDRENTQRRGSSIATRLYPILLSVQQFSGIVDTFASSNPAIAALVWGVVKLTMLVRYPFNS